MRRFIVAFLLMLLLPFTALAQASIPVATPAVAGSLIACTGPCNLYSFHISSGASAGFLLLFNQTTVPADGAVTPSACINVAANSTVLVALSVPVRFTTGMVAVFSTTGCFTKTISATAFISAGTI